MYFNKKRLHGFSVLFLFLENLWLIFAASIVF